MPEHHLLESACMVIDCPETHVPTAQTFPPACNAELELEGFVFICGRAAGHSLVHIDNSRARETGEPAWTMVWAGDPETVVGDVLEVKQ